MAIEIGQHSISRVHVIDDDASVRESYCENVQDMQLEPVEVHSVEDFNYLIRQMDPLHDGMICDYQLTAGKYSRVNGDVVASEAFKQGIPVILCTSYHPMTTLVGELRQFIPMVIHPNDLSKAAVEHAFGLCIAEREGRFVDTRKACRTLIRIEGIEEFGEKIRLSVQIPAWKSTGIVVDVRRSDFPILQEVTSLLDKLSDFRATAEINLGARSADELYFSNWKQL
jgi:hypothetical protein